MNLNEYQEKSQATAVYPTVHVIAYPEAITYNYLYPALGLAGETGEVVELIKKAVRSKKQVNVDKLKLELGDVLWYISAIAKEVGLSLDELAEANIEKLQERYKK